MTFSDENSCYNVVMNNNNEGRDPPTQTLDTTVNVEEDDEDHDMLKIGRTKGSTAASLIQELTLISRKFIDNGRHINSQKA